MKVGRFLLFICFLIVSIFSIVLSDNSFDIEIYTKLSNIGLYDYNSYIDEANEKNAAVGVDTLLQRIGHAIIPELILCYQINISPMILGLYLKNQYIFILNGSSVAQWGNGKPAHVVNTDFNVIYSGIGARISLSYNSFPYLTGFIGVDGGMCYYFWNNMYEETNTEAGINIYKIEKEWRTLIPGMNLDAGIQWMLNETTGLSLKCGYRIAAGNVTVKINNINGWTGPAESEDSVNYSGFYGAAGIIFKFGIQQNKDLDEKIDKSAKFPGLSEWVYKEAKSLYEEGLYKQAKEKILEAEKIAGENEIIIKLKNQIDRELNTENTTDKINKLHKRADEYRYKKQFQKARKVYQEIISIDEDNKQARFYLDEFDAKAEEELEKAKELVKQGRLKDALKSVNISVEYGDGKDAEDLKAEIENKIDRNKNKDKLYNEGVDKYRKGKYEEAIKKWEQVLQIDPSDRDAKKNIKKAMIKIKSIYKEEKDEIKKSIDDAKSFFNIGDFNAALERCEYVLRLSPDNTECKKMIEEIKKIQEENKVEVIKKR